MRVLCLLVLVLAYSAQRAVAADRPKIGIVLEGGGALGLAHIGVLKWFEEHRIPIDYVAGTSMGGLVGGMYATGMSADELRAMVLKIDWGKALDGQQTPYQALSFRRKEDKRAFQNNLEFGLRNGLSLPGGLNSGQSITFLFDRETLPYSDLKSFDDLPTPFRCVATDLVSGKQHIFESGPLGEALRATMSLPALFTPVSNDQSVWADGGLLNNLPVDIVKRMGAEIVIAVYLNPSPYRSGKGSMISVMNRSIGVMIEANELHSLETADLVVPVDLAGFTGADYASGAEIMLRGTAGAEKRSQLLARLAVDPETWQQHWDQRQSRRIRSTPDPTFISVTGIDPQLSRAIEQKLAPHRGKPIDLDKLESDITTINGTGRFTRFSYRMAERDGRPGLNIRGEEKDYAPPLLNIGFLVDGSDLANVRWTTNARITALDVGGFRSEWRTDISLGSTWGLASEYYRPFTPTSNWFVAPRGFANSNAFDLYDRTTQLAQYRIRRLGGGVDVGYAIDRFSELRVGYEIGDFQSSLRIGSPILPVPEGRTGATSIRYRRDHLDSPLVPRNGDIVSLVASWIDASPGSSQAFPVSDASIGVIRPVSKRGSAFLQGAGGSTFGHNDTGLPQFFLGGTLRLNAYGTNEIRTNQYWLARIGYVHELFNLPPIVGNKGYFVSAFEVGKTYGTPGISKLPMDGSAGLVIETLFGPLFLGGSAGDTGHRRMYFSLGRFF